MATHSSILSWKISWTESLTAYSLRGWKEFHTTELTQQQQQHQITYVLWSALTSPSWYLSWSGALDPKVSGAGESDTGEGHMCARHLATVTPGRWAARTTTDVWIEGKGSTKGRVGWAEAGRVSWVWLWHPLSQGAQEPSQGMRGADGSPWKETGRGSWSSRASRTLPPGAEQSHSSLLSPSVNRKSLCSEVSNTSLS